MYHVRDEDAALDIVQDSMMKLAQHYGDKPVGELPMLFQRILSNATLVWFRRRKTRNALFTNINDFESSGEEGEFDFLGTLESLVDSEGTESAQDATNGHRSCMRSNYTLRPYPDVNEKPFSCVTGKRWTSRKQLLPWAVQREVLKLTVPERCTL